MDHSFIRATSNLCFKICFYFKIFSWIERDKSLEIISSITRLLFAECAYLLCNSILMIERYIILTVWHVWFLDKRSLRLYLYFFYLFLFSLCGLCGYQMDCVADDARQVQWQIFSKFNCKTSNSWTSLIFQLMGFVECFCFQLFGALTYRITFSSDVFGSRCDSIASNKNGLFGHLCG